MNNIAFVTILNFQTTSCSALVAPDHLYPKSKHMGKTIYNYDNIFRNKDFLHKKINTNTQLKIDSDIFYSVMFYFLMLFVIY